jgi:hypothetical protein
MATFYSSVIPGVRDGLIFYLDAAKKDSYSGSGSTGVDLSNNKYVYTLENGTSHSGFSPTSRFTFDGSDDRIYSSDNLMSDLGVSSGIDNDVPYSIECIFRIHSNPPGIATSGYSLIGHASAGGIGLQVFNGPYINFGYRGNNNTTFTGQLLSLNTWYHVVCTRPSGGSSVTLTCYINGSSIGAVNNDLRVDYTTEQLQIGDAETRIGNLDGDIAIARVYNRALSSDEVPKNFNAFRGRYGL